MTEATLKSPLERAVYEAERNVKSFKRMIDNANEARARHEIVPEGRSAEKHLEMWTAILDALKSQEKPVEVTVKEFNDLIDPQMPSFNNIGNLLLNRFPNGIKIIGGVNHG